VAALTSRDETEVRMTLSAKPPKLQTRENNIQTLGYYFAENALFFIAVNCV
jgi:hypothetical protein